MVDIVVGRAMVYFSVGYMAKIGVESHGVVKSSLKGQNDSFWPF